MILRSGDWRRLLGGAALILLAVILVIDLGKLASTAIVAMNYPYDLDYGEGIVWQQMENIVAGRGYAPLGTFPAIVYHYPPVYHLTVAGLRSITGIDPLIAGRLVSLTATVASMAMIGWLSHAISTGVARYPRVIGAVLAAITFAISPTVVFWSTVMRVDMLATALTLAGLCLSVRAFRSPTRGVWPAVFFALAVYTKQTAILAPIAAFATWWMIDRRSAWRLLFVCGSMGIAALVALMLASQGQFLRHVVSYNVNRFDPSRWRILAIALGSQTINLTVALVVTAAIISRWRKTRNADWREYLAASPARSATALVVIYFALRLATIPLSLKSGSSDNYQIDLFAAAAVLVGIGIAHIAAAVFGGARWPRALVTLLLLVGLPIQASLLAGAHPAARSPAIRAEADKLVSRMAAAKRPVVTDFMVMLKRAGKPVRYEPAITAELGHSSLYDEAAFAAMVRHGDFAFFVTQGSAGVDTYDERYNPVVAAAIAAAYPRIEEHGGGMVLHLPANTPAVSR